MTSALLDLVDVVVVVLSSGGFQQFQLIMFFTARTNVNNEECLKQSNRSGGDKITSHDDGYTLVSCQVSGLSCWEFCTSCECNFLLCCKYFKTYFAVISLEFWLEKISPSMTFLCPWFTATVSATVPTLTQWLTFKLFSFEPLKMSVNAMIKFWANINSLS